MPRSRRSCATIRPAPCPVSQDAPFDNWMVAVAEAAEMPGVDDLDRATTEQLTRTWGVVQESADVPPEELAARIAVDAHLAVAERREDAGG